MKKSIRFFSLCFVVLFLFVGCINRVEYELKMTPNIPDVEVWEFYGGKSYYNKTNITKSFNIISFWVYTIVTDDSRKEFIEELKKDNLEMSKKYQNYDHDVVLCEIDCKKKLGRGKEFIKYDNKGNVLDHDIDNNRDWKNYPPDSIFDTLYQKVCVTQKETKETLVTSKVPDSKIWGNISKNWYYNKKNITKLSDNISIWVYTIVTDDKKEEMVERLKKGDLEKSQKYQNYDHEVTLWEIDCKKRLFRGKECLDYDDKGNVLNNLKDNTEWVRIVPDTPIGILYEIVCVN